MRAKETAGQCSLPVSRIMSLSDSSTSLPLSPGGSRALVLPSPTSMPSAMPVRSTARFLRVAAQSASVTVSFTWKGAGRACGRRYLGYTKLLDTIYSPKPKLRKLLELACFTVPAYSESNCTRPRALRDLLRDLELSTRRPPVRDFPPARNFHAGPVHPGLDLGKQCPKHGERGLCGQSTLHFQCATHLEIT